MPKVKLSKSFIDKIKTGSKIVDYFDTEIKGLLLRCYPSGNFTYQLYYRNSHGEQKRYTIAKHGAVNLYQAREIASKKMAEVFAGVDVQTEKQDARHTIRLGEYLDSFYYTWFNQNRKGDTSTINILKNTLKQYHNKYLDAIDKKLMNSFVTTYRNEHKVSNARINRIVTAIKAALTVAVEYKYARENKLKGFKMLHENKHSIVRYLTSEEESELMEACGTIYPVYKSIVMLALNTGMRAGEIKSLQWQDVNMAQQYIALRAENTKSQKVRYIPLNTKAQEALNIALEYKNSHYVYTNPRTKNRYSKHRVWFNDVLKAANIQNFRFHDLRHTFASKLVMRGVDLNTVRELMGHSDIKMTLVYAHLAPEHKQKAVDLL